MGGIAEAWRACSATILGLSLIFTSQAQSFNYVHPGSQPADSEFDQPPDGYHWVGPTVRQVSVNCWRAEPSEPSKPIGGSDQWQKVTGFVSLSLPPSVPLDSSFRQETLSRLAGGGTMTDLKAEQMPPGIFVSVKAHPVFKITKIEYPTLDPLPIIFGQSKQTGAQIYADFMHLPSMGECYFYVAFWQARKAK